MEKKLDKSSDVFNQIGPGLSLPSNLPLFHPVCERFQSPQVIVVCLSKHRHLLSSLPLTLTVSVIIKTKDFSGRRNYCLDSGPNTLQVVPQRETLNAQGTNRHES